MYSLLSRGIDASRRILSAVEFPALVTIQSLKDGFHGVQTGLVPTANDICLATVSVLYRSLSLT
jgi:hypothetical protein